MGKTTLIRWLLLVVAAVLFIGTTNSRADLGNAGPGPAPGLCQYPAVCGGGVAGAGAAAVYWYWEDFPVELNGSHRHCQWGGGATEANLGFSMILQVGVQAPLGAITGNCFYVCPDMQQADFPNPPGGWKDAIRPTKCQPIAPNPFEPRPPPQDVPIAPPIAEQGAVPQAPFQSGPPVMPPGIPSQPSPPGPPNPGMPGVSPPQPNGPTPPLAEQLPSVTNPVCPNPAATTDEACH
jgi:hypothetical protein